jgi:hypothetical protein
LQDEESVSDLSSTPFLEKFMKNKNSFGKDSKHANEEKIRQNIESLENSKIVSSSINNSAFQVVDYGYVASHSN